MKVKVLLFAKFRDVLGEYVEIDGVRTVKDVKERIKELLSKKGVNDIPILVAINGSYSQDDYEIKEDDEIVAFPPVSGG